MKHAFLILAHREPLLLRRLIIRLQSSETTFLVHVDRLVSFEPFRQACADLRNVHFIRRYESRWGSLGLVDATVEGLRVAEEIGGIRRITLLSGQHYPTLSGQALSDFFARSPLNFMRHFRCDGTMPSVVWQRKIQSERLDRYTFRIGSYSFSHPSGRHGLGLRMREAMLKPFWPCPRTHPSYALPYAGSQWWSLTWIAAAKILGFIREHPDFRDFHRWTHIPDELFFHTALLNAIDPVPVFNDHLLFSRWRHDDSAHPDVLSLADLDAVLTSGKPFIRKVSLGESADLLNALDAGGVS
ncbi:Core-2/I-Branching enzyme [Lacunisphaera limnophila]|uniref:Peptide O-xylosyltransferase n=1 Tax=Lacunisphaera limnophila TaxID=1838286 RepID=A0A1D8AZ42_9BACT|nr:beta-1,6-N-acetylglucosaminyltransferase [Lacunisphaera limnophila]AOS46124.1 Core-2/I-Branching enzyme [Lacunisphaera limnophila]